MKPNSSSRSVAGRRYAQRRSGPDGPRPRRFGGGGEPENGVARLYGLHAVSAALSNPKRTINRLLVTENAELRLKNVLAARQLAPERVTPRDLDRLLGAETVHQGVLAECAPLDEPTLAEISNAAPADAGPVVVLDQVTDPHNVGAILRSCAVFGASALVMTRRHSPPLDGTLAKSASGALELVPIVLAQNLARAIAELKEAAYVVIGLDDAGQALIEDEPFDTHVALVLGAEGKGLRELTRASCDRLVRIVTAGPIDSLNVSNAAAVALHQAAWRRRSR
jgi:23S rRNA (guanosine2251-2'-O)-methyltransferase